MSNIDPHQLALFEQDGLGTSLRIRRSVRARHLSLEVFPDGRVEVVVPPRIRADQVRSFVDDNRAWIERAGGNLHASFPDTLQLPDLIELQAIGERWPVDYSGQDGSRNRWSDRNGRLLVSPGRERPPIAAVVLQRWLASKGRRHLLPWLDELSRETGLEYRRVQIRGQRTCWGSCSSRGTISLNFGLLFVAPELVRYLLIHELCHLRFLNHSRRYWRLVERFEPDHRRLDRRLSEAQRMVPIWAVVRLRKSRSPSSVR